MSFSRALLVFICSFPVAVFGQSSNYRDEVSYFNDIQPLVKNFCVTCHAGEDPLGEFVLTSYQDVRKHVEKGELLKRINDPDNPMPQNGLMPQYMRHLFQAWADQGYKEKGAKRAPSKTSNMQKFQHPKISVVDVRKQGFEMLEYMQGHWVGTMKLMGVDYEWMAFDYRPIAPSHVHGIFEGGAIGNLFTSFFVAKFQGTQTLMARNGGLLNDIYRTSYFVLDKVQYGQDWAYYRLVDAYGGANVMYMELTFKGNTLDFRSYTSRFGLTEPREHMVFQAVKKRPELAAAAARAVGFPKNVVDYDFSQGLPKPTWATEYPQTSASYLWEDSQLDILELGKLARDPRRIDQMPYLSQLQVDIERNSTIRDKKLLVFLSQKALTNRDGSLITQFGYVREDLLDSLLCFPELGTKSNSFTFTYLHPGEYFLTVIGDLDGDGLPSVGDATHERKKIKVEPRSKQKVAVRELRVR